MPPEQSPSTNQVPSSNQTPPPPPIPTMGEAVSGPIPKQPATNAPFSSSTPISKGSKNTVIIIIAAAVVAMFIIGVIIFVLLGSKKVSAPENAKITTSSSGKTSIAARSVCMNNADYKELLGWDVPDGVEYSADNPLTDNVHFKPDTSEYEDTVFSADFITKWSDYAKNHPEKQFKYKLEGSVKEVSSTTDGDKLATERTDRVKNDLIKAGVPTDLITTHSYHQVDNTNAATDTSGLERVVTLAIDPTCTVKTGQ